MPKCDSVSRASLRLHGARRWSSCRLLTPSIWSREVSVAANKSLKAGQIVDTPPSAHDASEQQREPWGLVCHQVTYTPYDLV